MKEFHQRVQEAAAEGADFIKIMTTGFWISMIMEWSQEHLSTETKSGKWYISHTKKVLQ